MCMSTGRRACPARRRRCRGRHPGPEGAGRWRRAVCRRAARDRRRARARTRRRPAGQRSRLRRGPARCRRPPALAECVAERLRLAAENVLGHVDDRRLAAEPVDRLRQLHAHRAAAQYEQSAWHRLHAGRLAVGPDALEVAQAGDGRHDRIRAVRQHHVIGGVPLAVDLDPPGPASRPVPRSRSMPVVREPFLLAGVGVVGDHEVAPRESRLHVDLGARRRFARVVHRLARAEQCLRRHAGPVGALAARQLALNDRDPQAALGERSGAVLARRPGADDDDVVVAQRVVVSV